MHVKFKVIETYCCKANKIHDHLKSKVHNDFCYRKNFLKLSAHVYNKILYMTRGHLNS